MLSLYMASIFVVFILCYPAISSSAHVSSFVWSLQPSHPGMGPAAAGRRQTSLRKMSGPEAAVVWAHQQKYTRHIYEMIIYVGYIMSW